MPAIWREREKGRETSSRRRKAGNRFGRRRYMHRKWRAAALGVVLMVGVAGAAQAQEVLKIGGVGPLSGGGTAWGLAAQRGMELAVEEITAGGGFKAEGKAYKLE